MTFKDKAVVTAVVETSIRQLPNAFQCLASAHIPPNLSNS